MQEALFQELAEQAISTEVLLEKYAKGNEQNVTDVRLRVARALAAAERKNERAHWERQFFQAMEEGFIPAGRINSAAGTELQATLINCFVQPVGDAISGESEGKPGIYVALEEAADARPWNPPAAGAARRWACCAATTRTSRPSSTPRTAAT